jgi:energy-coupling factor transporter ATP-binding protein EcfA2
MEPSIDYLSIDEVRALIKAIEEPRDRAVITLFITTGLFVNELINLKVDDVDFDSRLITVFGNRERKIPLNDQAYEVLKLWMKKRVDTPCLNLFLTIKGKVQPMSVRGIDKLIRKYAKLAGIMRNVNSKVLRSTFAVNLFAGGIPVREAASILGISDSESIKRYVVASKRPITIPDIEHTDTRPVVAKILSNLFPKTVMKKARTRISSISSNPEEVIFGRDSVVKDILGGINKGQSSLIAGQLGIGKTHLLKHVCKIMTADGKKVIYIGSPTPLKEVLLKICEAINSDWKSILGSRPGVKELMVFLVDDKKVTDLLIIIDNLHKARAADIEMILELIEKFAILGSAEELVIKSKQLWWKFKVIEMKPISEDASKLLVKYLTQNLSVSDYDFLEMRLIDLADGIPLAIVDMIKQLSYKNIVDKNSIRSLMHDGGIKYREWKFAIVGLWCLVVMFRFIALGVHSFEGYILAGIGTSMLVMLRFFVLRMR